MIKNIFLLLLLVKSIYSLNYGNLSKIEFSIDTIFNFNFCDLFEIDCKTNNLNFNEKEKELAVVAGPILLNDSLNNFYLFSPIGKTIRKYLKNGILNWAHSIIPGKSRTIWRNNLYVFNKNKLLIYSLYNITFPLEIKIEYDYVNARFINRYMILLNNYNNIGCIYNLDYDMLYKIENEDFKPRPIGDDTVINLINLKNMENTPYIKAGESLEYEIDYIYTDKTQKVKDIKYILIDKKLKRYFELMGLQNYNPQTQPSWENIKFTFNQNGAINFLSYDKDTKKTYILTLIMKK